MKMRCAAAAGALFLLLLTGTSHADAVVNVFQVGSNVVATGSGSLNLTSLTFNATGAGGAGLYPADAFIQVGSGSFDRYFGSSGPASFGPSASFTAPTSSSGGFVGVNGRFNYILVPQGYVSGTSHSGSSTFNNTTIAGLGLTPGTYTYTWGSSSSRDSLTVNIQPVPEPSSLAIIGTFAAGLVAARRRRLTRMTR